MAKKIMYPGMVNSPETTITNNISESDTIIYVLDPARVPEPPNLMTLGTGTNAETVRVIEINGNAITVERGFQGVPKAWPAGTVIARNFTAYDYDALRENIEELETTKETPAGAQAKAEAAAGAALAAANAYTDQQVGEVSSDLIAHLADTAQQGVHSLKTTGSIKIYVDAANGNDSNPGTEKQPLKTINAAISRISSLIIDWGHIITIQLAPGTYTENVTIKNLYGAGQFLLKGGSNIETANNYVLDGRLSIIGCHCPVKIEGIKVMGVSDQDSALSIGESLSVHINYVKIDRTGRINSINNYGISVSNSLVRVMNSEISNIIGGSGINVAIMAWGCATVYSYINTGSNNGIGLRAFGGVIMKYETQPTGNINEVVVGGGVIR